MFAKPSSAFVGKPSVVASSSGARRTPGRRGCCRRRGRARRRERARRRARARPRSPSSAYRDGYRHAVVVITSLQTIALFSLAAVVALAIVPGLAVTCVAAQSVDKGRRAGLDLGARSLEWCSRARGSRNGRPFGADRVLGDGLHRREAERRRLPRRGRAPPDPHARRGERGGAGFTPAPAILRRCTYRASWSTC